MKKQTMFSVLMAVLCVSSAAFGQDEPKRERPAGPRQAQGGGRPDMAGAMAQRLPLMMALDADKDGTISASELANASKSLAKLDKDGDGVLSAEELRPDFSEAGRERTARDGKPGASGAPNGEMMARMFEQRDTNKDGKLSGDEIPERMRENLARIDADGNGSIDKAEMQKAMAQIGERAGQARGAKGDKEGAGVKPKRPSAE